MLRLAMTALAFVFLVSGCSFLGDKTEPAPPPPVKAAEPAPPPPPPPPPPLTHTIKKGETIASLTKRYHVSAKDLLAANNLNNAKAIKPGMVLTIPGKAAPDVTKPTGKIDAPEPKAEKPTKGGKKDPYGIDAAMAPDKKGKGKKGGKFIDDDATYERVKTEFHEYARKWLEKSQHMSEYSKSKKEVKQDEGRYVATYTEILMDSMDTEVKRVDYEGTPYVGHITYRMRVHRTFGPSPQAAQASNDEIVQEEFMREIFSYSGQKRAWR